MILPGTQEPSLQLMAHQEEAVTFLLERKSGLIALEQGLGKTVVALEAFRRLQALGAATKLLVICPNSIKRNWAAEIARFNPDLNTCVVQGPAAQRRQLLGTTKSVVVLINYEAARNEITAVRAMMQRAKAVLVLDESHFVKNMRSLNSIAARNFAPLSEYRWLLSGTPVPNAPVDIYSQLLIVAGEREVGSLDTFMAHYGDAEHNAHSRDALARKIAPWTFRRTKEQCLDLPEKIFVNVYVQLPAWQRRLYEKARDGLIREVRSIPAEGFRAFATTALARLLRLSQIASNPAIIFDDEHRLPGKFQELDGILHDLILANGRKVVLWSQYVRTIEMLATRYAALGTLTLYGAVPAEERQDVVRRFQEDHSVRLLVGNPAAGGTGFTLTAASYTIYETLSWRFDLYAQSQDRVHRIGQTLPVTYIRLMAEDTIDEVIAAALERKAVMAQAIVGDTPLPILIHDLTPEQFCTMLMTNVLPESNSHSAHQRRKE